jgi:uncharacterized protein YjbI with pentapeptide repeats
VQSLLAQSRAASRGLWLIVFGSVLQGFAAALSFYFPPDIGAPAFTRPKYLGLPVDEPGNKTASGEHSSTAIRSGEYNQAFFLELAAKGKDEWSRWQNDPANEDVRVTFAGCDFCEEPTNQINFEGFAFRDDADFSGCKWRSIGEGTIQNGPQSPKLGQANFVGAQFAGRANFTGANFGSQANFASANFADCARFTDAEFRNEVTFSGATFGAKANFEGTAFRDAALFDQTHFQGAVTFKRTRIDFLTVVFAHARFDGEAVFSGQSFEQSGDFTSARFYSPPDFDAVRNPARIDFTGADIAFVRPGRLHWTCQSRIPVRLRALRKIAEESKNHDLERDLYIEERKAERGVYLRQRWEELKMAPWTERPLIAWRLFGHVCWIVVMFLYWVLGQAPDARTGQDLLQARLIGAADPRSTFSLSSKPFSRKCPNALLHILRATAGG